LFRDAQAIESLSHITTLIFDKTGTLTEGRPRMTFSEARGTLSSTRVLELAASLERGSGHPLAWSMAQEAQRQGLTLTSPQEIKMLPALGIEGKVGEHEVSVGNRALLSSRLGADFGKLDLPTPSPAAAEIFVVVDRKLEGILHFEDPLRPGVKKVIQKLSRHGLQLILCTGDREAVALRVGQSLGIGEIHFQVTPLGKAELVTRLQKEGRRIAMVGDGVNDAVALAQADVGIAIGTGSEAAIENAGVVLLQGDIAKVGEAFRLSRRILGTMRQNLFLAFFYNGAAIPIAAGVLTSVLHLTLNPMLASLLMSLSSVSVIANSLRLNRVSVSSR
jgi:Cu+-exporting ATPase